MLPTYFSSYKSLEIDENFAKYIKKLIKTHEIDAIILGNPVEYQVFRHISNLFSIEFRPHK